MARIRTIKPEFWGDPKTARCSRDARLLFLGLLNESDDAGRQLGNARKVAGSVFPNDDDVSPKMVDKWLTELERERFIVRYTVENVQYIAIVGFATHQKISHPTPSRLPPPSDNFLRCAGITPESLRRVSGSDLGKGSRNKDLGGGSVGPPSVEEPELNDPTEPPPPTDVDEQIRVHRWAPGVDHDEINEAIEILRHEHIADATLLEALTTSDPFPSKWKHRARALHAERKPTPRPECTNPACINSMVPAVDGVAPCPDCHPLGIATSA